MKNDAEARKELGVALATILLRQFMINHHRLMSLYRARDFERASKLCLAQAKIAALLDGAKQKNELPPQHEQQTGSGVQ